MAAAESLLKSTTATATARRLGRRCGKVIVNDNAPGTWFHFHSPLCTHLETHSCSWNSLGTRLETEAFSCLGKPLTCFSILELPKTSNVTATVTVPIIHTYYIVHISHVVVVHNYLCTRLSLVGSAQCRVLKCTVYCACVLFIKRTALIWLAVESAETPPTAHGMHCILLLQYIPVLEVPLNILWYLHFTRVIVYM